MSSIKAQLDLAYKRKVEDELLKRVRKTILSIYSNIVLMTPVDTGRARSNWNVDINIVDVQIVEPTSKDPGPEKALSAIARYKLNDVAYISNNLPYIRRLNEGYSQQAPAAFVETAVDIGKRQAQEL